MPASLTELGASKSTLLYPRLPRAIGIQLLEHRANLSLQELEGLADIQHRAAAPAATGGVPVGPARIERVQRAVRDVARSSGYPGKLTRSGAQDFDRLCGTSIYRTMDIVPGDAANEDVWSFLSLVVLPEIGSWRFPGFVEERLLGKPRNVLRRLWWRAWALGPDLDSAPEGCAPLGEDEFVGIMERSSIGGNPRLARFVQETIWKAGKEHPTLPRTDLARQLTRRLRAFFPQLCFDAMADSHLRALLAEVTSTSLSAVVAERTEHQSKDKV